MTAHATTTAQEKCREGIAANWEPNVWYRLKLAVEVNGGKTMVRGKWWERSKPEPKDWALEVEDPRPNAEGAAALFADARAPEAEIHYDNVVVTPNK